MNSILIYFATVVTVLTTKNDKIDSELKTAYYCTVASIVIVTIVLKILF